MRERPILFSAPMVRAILAGTKTQTRRIVKLDGRTIDSRTDGTLYVARCTRSPQETSFTVPCPYGAPGDKLWVRETWYCDNTTAPNWNPGKDIAATPELIAEWGESLYYRADAKATGTCCELIPECACAEFGERSPWKPSIHMPRWASRITLEVTGVRVERLHAITEEDARSEGVERAFDGDRDLGGWEVGGDLSCRTAFEILWKEINSAKSWDANPYVWVVEFRRIEAPT